MKQSFSTKFIYLVFAAGVLLYFGMQGYRYLANPQTSAAVYAYETERVLPLSGFFVRDETVLHCSEPLLEVERAEGERVGKNDTIATIYHSEGALSRHEELTKLEQRLEQLQYAQSATQDAETALKLDGDIREKLFTLRAAVAAGSYHALESVSTDFKTTVLKYEYAYRGTSDLSEDIESLKAQVRSLRGELSGGTERLRAGAAGTYSSGVDGYEAVLTPEALETMTVRDFKALRPDGSASGIGRLIEGERWYYAALADEADAARLWEGQTLKLRAEVGVDFDLDVQILRISEVQDGKVLLVLCGDRYLAYVTLLRDQKAELILETYTGLRVPKNALRVDENGRSGVYCRVGLRAYFKPVDVLYQGEDYILVRPVRIDSTSNSKIQLYTLRAGDEAIITAEELSDGKVIE